MQLMNGWEVSVGAVNPEELRQLGRSYWLHVDRGFMAHIGCLARVVVCGWGIEVYGPTPTTATEPTG